jgi:hypothetical protein
VEIKVIVVLFVLFIVTGFLFKALQAENVLDFRPARHFSAEKPRKSSKRKGKGKK